MAIFPCGVACQRKVQKQSSQIQQLTARSVQKAERIQRLIEQHEQDAAQNRRLSPQMAELKGMVEQAVAAQKGAHLATVAPSTSTGRRAGRDR